VSKEYLAREYALGRLEAQKELIQLRGGDLAGYSMYFRGKGDKARTKQAISKLYRDDQETLTSLQNKFDAFKPSKCPTCGVDPIQLLDALLKQLNASVDDVKKLLQYAEGRA